MANFRLNADKAEKTAPVDDDIYMIEDSAAAYGVKYVKQKNIIGVGSIKDHPSSSLTGHLLCNGETIGDVASGADNESADYETLFEIIKSKTEYGNTGSEVWANGDTVKLPDYRYEYGSFSMSGDQSTNLSAGNHIEFDTIISGNMSLSTGSGQANGLVSVNPYKIYKINLSTRCTYSSSNGESQFYMYDETGTTVYVSVGRTRSIPITDSNNMDIISSNCGYIDDLTVVSNISAYIGSSTNIATIQNDATILTIETPFLTKENTFIKY